MQPNRECQLISFVILLSQEVVIKEYQNYKFQQPYQQAIYYCLLILQDQTWPWVEQLEVLPHLDSSDLERFVPLMLSRTFLECYIAGLLVIFKLYFQCDLWWYLVSVHNSLLIFYFVGNIESSEAESMILHIEDILFKNPKAICRTVFPSQLTANRVVKLKRGLSYYYPVEGLNKDDDNSSLVHYIQVSSLHMLHNHVMYSVTPSIF